MKLYHLIDIGKMAAQRHRELLFSFVQVAIQHLDNGIFHVHFTLMTLAQNLQLLSERFDLGKTHQFSPLVIDTVSIQLREALFFLLPFLQFFPPCLQRPMHVSHVQSQSPHLLYLHLFAHLLLHLEGKHFCFECGIWVVRCRLPFVGSGSLDGLPDL